ncbi:hypothetical protein VUR80DRAFT_8043 [Thermomyces stellatus]
MNASALLQAQGWRGEGHTLHATSDSIGLKNRLLVSRKADTSGLGASQYANDQWWLSALDEQLGGLSTKNGKVVQTVKDGKLDRLKENVGKSELYKFFVSGGTLQGTVDKFPAGTKDDAASPQEQPRPESTSSDSESGKMKESKEERRARKAARRERREQKRARREARKQKSRSASSTDADEGTDGAKGAKGETKEERRARKEARRKRKEEKRRSRR